MGMTEYKKEIIRNQQNQLNADLNDSIERRDIKDVIKHLKRGANINKQAYTEQYSPLIKAIILGDINIVNVLIDRGADINLLTKAVHVLEHEADDEDIEHADFDMFESSITPLIAAVKYNQVEIVTLLLDKSANIHAKDLDGDNVMSHSIYIFMQEPGGNNKSTLNMVSLLLSKGANFQEKNNQGISAMDKAKENFPELAALFENHLLTTSANQAVSDHSDNASSVKRNRL